MITDIREYYKPFEFPEVETSFTEKQQNAHWLKRDVILSSDLEDWNQKLTDGEKYLIGNILKGFTQAEVLVGDYWRRVADWFPKPEISALTSTMSYFESIHQQAYDLLNSTLGLNNYEAFIQDKETKDKLDMLIEIDKKTLSLKQVKRLFKLKKQQQILKIKLNENKEYIQNDKLKIKNKDKKKLKKSVKSQYESQYQELENEIKSILNTKYDKLDVLKSLAIFSAFTEGVLIFSSFIILKSFSQRNLMKGTTSIIDWSVRDESLHSKAGIYLYNIYLEELKQSNQISTKQINKLENNILNASLLVFDLESKFIDKCFEYGNLDCLDLNYKPFDLTPIHIKLFIHYRIVLKLQELNLSHLIDKFNSKLLNQLNEQFNQIEDFDEYKYKVIEILRSYTKDDKVIYNQYLYDLSWFNAKEFKDFFVDKITEYTKYTPDTSIDIEPDTYNI